MMKFQDANVYTPSEIQAGVIQGKRWNPVYIGYFLTRNESDKLKTLFSKTYGKKDKILQEKAQFGHVTLQFGPSHPQLLEYMLNTTLPEVIEVEIDKLYVKPQQISAFTVKLPTSIQEQFSDLLHPHITAYHARTIAPFQSNMLIQDIDSLHSEYSDGIYVRLYLGLMGTCFASSQEMLKEMIQYELGKNVEKDFIEIETNTKDKIRKLEKIISGKFR